ALHPGVRGPLGGLRALPPAPARRAELPGDGRRKALAAPDRQRGIPGEPRIGGREPAEIEGRSADRAHDLRVSAPGAEPDPALEIVLSPLVLNHGARPRERAGPRSSRTCRGRPLQGAWRPSRGRAPAPASSTASTWAA